MSKLRTSNDLVGKTFLMALDLDEHDSASYYNMSSGEENNNSDHDFSIDEPSMSADNGLSSGVSHLRGARVGVRKSSHI